MMLRSTWRYPHDDPPARRWFTSAVIVCSAVVFGTVWVVASVMLLGVALRFF